LIDSRMSRTLLALVAGSATMVALLPAAVAHAATASGPPVMTGATVTPAVHQDVSVPLGEMVDQQGDHQGQHEDHHAKPLDGGRHGNSGTPGVPSSTTTTAAPTLGNNWLGVGAGFSGPQGTFSVAAAPPDTNIAVGPSDVVELVNTDLAVFNKANGSVRYGPVSINTVWSGFGGGCQTNNDGDPIVEYDSMANRWVISQFSVTTTPYLQCVAVSTTGDPTGNYNRYSFQYNDFPDYPKLSVWPDAYYITFNMFAGGTSFSGGQACAYDRASMLAGASATQQCFNLGTTFGGLLPSDLSGSRQPPAGSPNYILALGANANELAFWKFHTDWTTPGNTTFTGPSTIATAAYSMACAGGTCIPQAGTSQQLDSLADRLMYRLAYRNFGDHEALVVNHSVTAGSSVGVRWYELRSPSTTPTIFQQGTYAPDSSSRWMGSIAMDQAGNMGLGFSVSSASLHPEIHYTGRLAGDALGTMGQGEGTIFNGAGSQNGGLSRWGDYSAMSIDPSDDCTFWYANQYLSATGSFNWSTRIGSFKFAGCGGVVPNDFSIVANPTTLTVTQGGSGTSTISTATTSGSAQAVNLTVSGAPSGATASLSPTSVTSGGSSTLTISSGTAAAGNYTITVTGTGASATHTTTVALTVNAATTSGIVNGGFETGTFSGWTTAGPATSITNTSHSGTYAAMVGGTTPTNGDSSIAQTFMVPSGSATLRFWYQVHCPDTLTYDWATATLLDNTASTSTTVLAPTCSNGGPWTQVTAPVTPGHSYTLTLVSHDDNYPSDPTYALYDDVALSAPPAPDFSILASPSSVSVTQGSSASSTISTTTTSGSPQTVNLTVSGAPSGASASLSPTSVTSGGSSTLTLNSGTAAPGTYTLTVTGTGTSATHTTTVSLTITAPVNNDFSISASPSSGTATQGSSTSSTISTAVTSGSAQTVALSASGLPSGASASFNPTSVSSGGSSGMTVTTSASTPVGTYTITVTGTGTSATHTTTFGLTVSAPVIGGITNGGFETGTFSGWTRSGAATSIVTTSHSGTYAAQLGGTSPTSGDSRIAQTFTASTGSASLSLWYESNCPDTVTYDWVTVTLRDNTTGITRTVVPRTCARTFTWTHVTAGVTAGHSYTLTLTSHDDNWPTDPTYTIFDDVTLQ
jgi:hypothetical protein